MKKISTNEYQIDVLDLEGNMQYKIKKDYRKLLITEGELEEYLKTQNKTLGEETNRDYKYHYKKAVDAMSMFEDKNGNLIIEVPLERTEENKNDFIVDAFKDGVFLNRFKIDIGRLVKLLKLKSSSRREVSSPIDSGSLDNSFVFRSINFRDESLPIDLGSLDNIFSLTSNS